MKTLIYLEDAIAAISVSAFSINTVYGRSERGMKALQDAVMALKALPSAEPEVIRCKNCEWWEKQKDSVQGRCELMQMYPAGGWFCGNARRRESNEA